MHIVFNDFTEGPLRVVSAIDVPSEETVDLTPPLEEKAETYEDLTDLEDED